MSDRLEDMTSMITQNNSTHFRLHHYFNESALKSKVCVEVMTSSKQTQTAPVFALAETFYDSMSEKRLGGFPTHVKIFVWSINNKTMYRV